MATQGDAVVAVALAIGVVCGSGIVWLSLPHPALSRCEPAWGLSDLVFGRPAEEAKGGDHWYNFTLQAAGGGLAMDNFAFQIEDSNGTAVTPGPAWTLQSFDPKGNLAGVFDFTGPAAGTWPVGGEAPAWGGQVFSLLTSPDGIAGDTFVTNLLTGPPPCPMKGTVTTAIP